MKIPELSMDDDGKDTDDTETDSDSDSEEAERPTPRTATPSEVDLEEATERIRVAPIAVPSRPAFGRRLSAYQNTPLDVERGRSARQLRNSRPGMSI